MWILFKVHMHYTPKKIISSNDILTSWLTQLCRCSHVLMATNLREKVRPYTDSLAGNYESVILHPRNDIMNPEQVRKSLGIFTSHSKGLPSVLETLQNRFWWLPIGEHSINTYYLKEVINNVIFLLSLRIAVICSCMTWRVYICRMLTL